jgi:hypothetical protein
MIKGQYHENFKSFTGTDLSSLSKEASNFIKVGDFAAKSLAVLANEGGYVVSIGYSNDQPGYPVFITEVGLEGATDIDVAINEASDAVAKEVICHSLYSRNGKVYVAFLIHG